MYPGLLLLLLVSALAASNNKNAAVQVKFAVLGGVDYTCHAPAGVACTVSFVPNGSGSCITNNKVFFQLVSQLVFSSFTPL